MLDNMYPFLGIEKVNEIRKNLLDHKMKTVLITVLLV